MKSIQKLLAIIGLLTWTGIAAEGQNSTCVNPSGPMQQPLDTTPTCFAGYSGPNSGSLTQYYTFTATSAEMAVELTPVLGTSCSFPNTGILYSNFQLLDFANCVSPLSASPNFSNLVVGNQYTFGLTMTPMSPSCVWISQACPRVVEVTIPLEADLLYFTGRVTRDQVSLKWALPEGQRPYQFVVMRRESPVAKFEKAGIVDPDRTTANNYSWQDPKPAAGLVQYCLVVEDQNGNRTMSRELELHVDRVDALIVYPNPTHGDLSVSFPDGSHQCYAVWLYDDCGRLRGELHGSGESINTELPTIVSGLAPGMYVIQCHDGKVRESARFFKI